MLKRVFVLLLFLSISSGVFAQDDWSCESDPMCEETLTQGRPFSIGTYLWSILLDDFFMNGFASMALPVIDPEPDPTPEPDPDENLCEGIGPGEISGFEHALILSASAVCGLIAGSTGPAVFFLSKWLYAKYLNR